MFFGPRIKFAMRVLRRQRGVVGRCGWPGAECGHKFSERFLLRTHICRIASGSDGRHRPRIISLVKIRENLRRELSREQRADQGKDAGKKYEVKNLADI